MTAPSHLGFAGRPVGRRRLRRLSRRFAGVGVHVPPDRLAAIAAGQPASDDELFNVAFAETATLFRCEQRRARRCRMKRRGVHAAIVFAAMVLALAAVLCLGSVFFLLAVHATPF